MWQLVVDEALAWFVTWERRPRVAKRREPAHPLVVASITWLLTGLGLGLAASAVMHTFPGQELLPIAALQGPSARTGGLDSGDAPPGDAPPLETPVPEPAMAQAVGAAHRRPGVPARLEIPALGVSAPIRRVGLTDDGALEVPDAGDTGWFDASPRPGAPGHAVIAGHVDSYEGPDVFYRLGELAVGDEVRVRTSTGRVVMFLVEAIEQQPKESLPRSRMWRWEPRRMLALITCGGEFDRRNRTYRDNVVAYAAMAPDSSLAASTRRTYAERRRADSLTPRTPTR